MEVERHAVFLERVPASGVHAYRPHFFAIKHDVEGAALGRSSAEADGIVGLFGHKDIFPK